MYLYRFVAAQKHSYSTQASSSIAIMLCSTEFRETYMRS